MWVTRSSCSQLSSEDISASLGEESLLEDRDEEPQQESKHAPHPAGQKQPQSPLSCVTIINPWLGNVDIYLVDLWYYACNPFNPPYWLLGLLFTGIVLNRIGYYTIPSMEDLADMVDENGECVVENFSVGRKGNRSQLTSHLVQPSAWQQSYYSVLTGLHRIWLYLLSRWSERDGTKPWWDCPLQTQGGHCLPRW